VPASAFISQLQEQPPTFHEQTLEARVRLGIALAGFLNHLSQAESLDIIRNLLEIWKGLPTAIKTATQFIPEVIRQVIRDRVPPSSQENFYQQVAEMTGETKLDPAQKMPSKMIFAIDATGIAPEELKEWVQGLVSRVQSDPSYSGKVQFALTCESFFEGFLREPQAIPVPGSLLSQGLSGAGFSGNPDLKLLAQEIGIPTSDLIIGTPSEVLTQITQANGSVPVFVFASQSRFVEWQMAKLRVCIPLDQLLNPNKDILLEGTINEDHWQVILTRKEMEIDLSHAIGAALTAAQVILSQQ
jgi:hypothetical protein